MQQESLPLAMAHKKEAVGTIPVLPPLYLLERTALKIPEDAMSASTLLGRILEYLRVQSISFECEQGTGCLDCMAPTSMVGFVVQLWRASVEGQKVLWMEVHRRRGCGIAMSAIRRSLVRHVNAEEPAPQPLAGQRRPFEEPSYCTGSNKRPRSLPPVRSLNASCQEALAISCTLLESKQRDRQKLGLESLNVLTNPLLVRAGDAATASRSVILGEGILGGRLQLGLVTLLQEVKPVEDEFHHHRGSMSAILYHFALHVLANGLEQAAAAQQQQLCNINLHSIFWQTIVACLHSSLQTVLKMPHEAALSAKCIRYLLVAQQAAAKQSSVDLPATQTALRRAHAYGRTHHMALEKECQKTLLGFRL